MRKAILIILLSLLSFRCFATCIIIIIEKGFVIVAADSKVVGANKEVSKMNKIKKAGNFYVTMAGFAQNLTSGYNAMQTIQKFLGDKAVYTPDVRDRLKTELIKMITNEMKIIRQHPRSLKLFPNRDAVILHYAVVGFYKDKAFAHTVEFRAPNINEDKIEVTEDKFQTEANTIKFIGEAKQAQEYLKNHDDLFSTMIPPQAINKLFDVAIKYNSDGVGKPIKILLLSKDKAQWVQ